MKDQESKARKREEQCIERLEQLENTVFAQHEKLDKLEGLMYRVMHRDQVGLENGLRKTDESPKYEKDSDTNRPVAGQGVEPKAPGPDRTKPYYSISSV